MRTRRHGRHRSSSDAYTKAAFSFLNPAIDCFIVGCILLNRGTSSQISSKCLFRAFGCLTRSRKSCCIAASSIYSHQCLIPSLTVTLFTVIGSSFVDTIIRSISSCPRRYTCEFCLPPHLFLPKLILTQRHCCSALYDFIQSASRGVSLCCTTYSRLADKLTKFRLYRYRELEATR